MGKAGGLSNGPCETLTIFMLKILLQHNSIFRVSIFGNIEISPLLRILDLLIFRGGL